MGERKLMRTKIIVFLIALFCLPVLAQETITYLVYVKTLPNETDKIDLPVKEPKAGFENIMDKGLKKFDGQPFRMTRKIQGSNTDYVKVVITPADDTEKGFLNGLIQSGKMLKISGSELVTTLTPQKGGWITEIKETIYNNLPADYGNDYSVKVSS